LGRKKIAHITGDPGYRAARDRAAALIEVLDAAGLPLIGEALFGQWSQRWGRHATARLLATHPDGDAIFCGSDQIAAGGTEALRDVGGAGPEDVAIVGYDTWEVIATECRPPLTTVALNLEQLGTTAVRHLFAALDGNRHGGVIRQPGRLVVRE